MGHFEDDRPTEPGLRRFEHKKLKIYSVIVDWYAPFGHTCSFLACLRVNEFALINQDRLVPDGHPDGALVP